MADRAIVQGRSNGRGTDRAVVRAGADADERSAEWGAGRAVLYARVSADDRNNNGRNLAGQIDMGRNHCAERHYHIVAELPEDDRGASGAAFELPQLGRVLEMARAGQFDVLIVREIDRLSRNLAKQLLVEEELKRSGVRIEYVLGEYPDTPEGNLMKNIRASIAEYERLKINERIIRGKALKVKAGSVMLNGHRIYGYMLVARPVTPGKPDGPKLWALEVFEPEAQVVRLIFTWYTKGDGSGSGPLSLQAILRRVNAMGVPTLVDNDVMVRGKATRGTKTAPVGCWSRSSIFQIVINETYTGVWQYGKRSATGQEGTVTVPAIVDRETFDLAAERRKINKQLLQQRGRRTYLLSGMLKCGTCGRKLAASTKQYLSGCTVYYCCKAALSRNVRPCPQHTFFRGDDVERAIWSWVKDFLLDPRQLAQGLAAYQAERQAVGAPLRERLQVVDGLLAENRARLARLLDLYLTGDFSKQMLVDRKTHIEGAVSALEAERRDITGLLQAGELTAGQIETMQAFATQVAAGIEEAEIDPAQRRALYDAIELSGTLAVENDQRVIYARCILGETNAETSVLSGNTRAAAASRDPR